MNFEFKLYKLKETATLMKTLNKAKELYKTNFPNEFIVVGKEKDELKVVQLINEGIRLINGLKLDQISYTVSQNDIEGLCSAGIGTDYVVIDIPKKYLNIDIIEVIKELNE